MSLDLTSETHKVLLLTSHFAVLIMAMNVAVVFIRMENVVYINFAWGDWGFLVPLALQGLLDIVLLCTDYNKYRWFACEQQVSNN